MWIVLIASLVLGSGCGAGNAEFLTEDRLAQGLVIILPGIEGEGFANYNIRDGLVAAGVYRGLPIYSWGRPIPLVGVLVNQVDFIGNRLAGERIAQMITDYQDTHPGMPVYLVGHSGGGGVAVFAAEAMPEDRKVDGLILLSASISGPYDLTKALSRCKNGIVNFYNRADVALLGVGTTFFGNVDGGRGPSAGLTGFTKPAPDDPDEKRLAYAKLYEIELTPAMTGGNGGAHFSTTRVGFVSTHVAPWVLASTWPPQTTYAYVAFGEALTAKTLARVGN
jgi:pimeloyl-ACP methyl ester carboxylesterase